MSITTTPTPATPAPADLQPLAPPDPDAERRRAFVRESLERKQRADSFFHSLSPEQATQLLDWLQHDTPLSTIMRNMAAPPPEGFGLKVQLTSLRRFRAYCRGLDEAIRTEEILDTIEDMDRHCDLSQQPRVQQAISQMLHEKAFELARTQPGSEVLTNISKLATLDHKREKLLLDRQKLLRSFHPSTSSPKHHRVDLNIIPPARPISETPAVQIDALPQPTAPQLSDTQTATEASELPPTPQPIEETHANPLPKAAAKPPKISRNDPCSCGSGLKYKKCCALKSLPLRS